MRRRFALSLALWAASPVTSWAEPAVVQSGEHENFTRLVTRLGADQQWQISQKGELIRITLEDYDDGFDTNRIYDRIPRNRIAALEADTNSLTLSLGCDCIASTFLVAGPFLVIDVAARGVSLPGTPVPVIPETVDPEPVQQVLPLSPIAPRARPARATAALPSLSATLPESVAAEIPKQSPLGRDALRPEERRVLSDMKAQLARELGTAATRGVLTPAPDRNMPDVLPLVALNPPPVEAPTDEIGPAVGPLAPGPHANVRISSSLDLPNTTTRAQINITGLSCPSTTDFEVAAWGNRDPFYTQIAAARDGLYGELDRLNAKAAKTLAQTYLFFGFGVEARQVLSLDADLAKENPHLLALADLMDGLPPDDPAVLQRAADCDPKTLLWATLAAPDPVVGAKPDVDAILRALNDLPLHLRQTLAPALSRKLLAYGDAQAAAQALRSLKRTPAQLPPAARLAQAALDIHSGDAESGTSQLTAVAAENTDQSPRALIALVEAQIAADQPVTIDIAELIEAYAKELQDTDLGPDLRRAHVLALLKSGQFDAAFKASAALGGTENTPAALRLRAQMLRELIAAADDIVFLEHIFAQRDADMHSLPAADLTALAARFLSLGFAERAERMLAHLPNGPVTEEQKLLVARVALDMGKPGKAQAALAGMESRAAKMLRADAKRMAGAYREAHALYAQADQAAPAAESAWMSEDWQGLTDTQTPVFGPAARLASVTEVEGDDTGGMLSRSAAALAQSEAARDTLENLLGADALQLLAQD